MQLHVENVFSHHFDRNTAPNPGSSPTNRLYPKIDGLLIHAVLEISKDNGLLLARLSSQSPETRNRPPIPNFLQPATTVPWNFTEVQLNATGLSNFYLLLSDHIQKINYQRQLLTTGKGYINDLRYITHIRYIKTIGPDIIHSIIRTYCLQSLERPLLTILILRVPGGQIFSYIVWFLVRTLI